MPLLPLRSHEPSLCEGRRRSLERLGIRLFADSA
jgi:hypothetical protein